jgi:hypothetical protein
VRQRLLRSKEGIKFGTRITGMIENINFTRRTDEK